MNGSLILFAISASLSRNAGKKRSSSRLPHSTDSCWEPAQQHSIHLSLKNPPKQIFSRLKKTDLRRDEVFFANRVPSFFLHNFNSRNKKLRHCRQGVGLKPNFTSSLRMHALRSRIYVFSTHRFGCYAFSTAKSIRGKAKEKNTCCHFSFNFLTYDLWEGKKDLFS